MLQRLNGTKAENVKFQGGEIKSVLGDGWRNTKVHIISNVPVVIPESIVGRSMFLNKRFSQVEFSIFLKFNYDKNQRKIVVLEEYQIPDQLVSFAFIDYKEQPLAGFTGIMHRHPDGYRNFSGTDNTYINQNYDLSLLWEGNNFVTGHIRVKTEYGRIAIPLSFEYTIPTVEYTVPEELLSKIKPRCVCNEKRVDSGRDARLAELRKYLVRQGQSQEVIEGYMKMFNH